MRCAVFIDRDGVICRNRDDHVKSLDELEIIPDSLTAISSLADTDFLIIIITNQAIIGDRIVSPETVQEINDKIISEAKKSGGRIDAVMVCPHRRDEGCFCRKPYPGLLLEAADKFDINLSQSYVIGDAITDMMAGDAVGCECIMVLTGRGIKESSKIAQSGIYVHLASDLGKAVNLVREGFLTI